MLIITLIGLFGIISVAIAIYINLRGKWADMPNDNRRKNHQIIYNEKASGWRLFFDPLGNLSLCFVAIEVYCDKTQ